MSTKRCFYFLFIYLFLKFFLLSLNGYLTHSGEVKFGGLKCKISNLRNQHENTLKNNTRHKFFLQNFLQIVNVVSDYWYEKVMLIVDLDEKQ